MLQLTMAKVLEMDDTSALFSIPQGVLDAVRKVQSLAVGLPRFGPAHLELMKAFRMSGPAGQSL